MNSSMIPIAGVIAIGALAIICLFVVEIVKNLRRPTGHPLFSPQFESPPVDPSKVRTSALAFFSFAFGMLTALAVMASGFVVWMAEHAEGLDIPSDITPGMLLAAKITALCALAPALASLGFFFGARGVIRDSGGALVGRSLYKTGMLATVVSMAFAWPVYRGTMRLEELESTVKEYGSKVVDRVSEKMREHASGEVEEKIRDLIRRWLKAVQKRDLAEYSFCFCIEQRDTTRGSRFMAKWKERIEDESLLDLKVAEIDVELIDSKEPVYKVNIGLVTPGTSTYAESALVTYVNGQYCFTHPF